MFPWHYFTDPVLQAPIIGSMLMCLASALIGVLVFLRRRSLLGEALSHASYPGVVISLSITALFFPEAHDAAAVIVLIGAFCSASLGLFVIEKMERSLKVKNDAALCFVLSIFFGIGILIASRLQISHALWYKAVQVFLYGQAATMTDVHMVVYAVLSALIMSILFLFYHPLQIAIFDRDYARVVRVPITLIDMLTFVLLILAIIVGIRSVGVVLMAGMLIAPAIAARALSDRLSVIFVLAALIGMLSGFFGNYFAVEIPRWSKRLGWEGNLVLPTGPMILLCAASVCFFVLLFAPKSGFIRRLMRAVHFQRECQRENLLKILWKKGQNYCFSFAELQESLAVSSWWLFWIVRRLKREGWIKCVEKKFLLTSDGWQRAAHIIRLHRLWEVYLFRLGQGIEKVHRSAEEMEHILTPELERELTLLLDNPKLDPHKQPIPAPGGSL